MVGLLSPELDSMSAWRRWSSVELLCRLLLPQETFEQLRRARDPSMVGEHKSASLVGDATNHLPVNAALR